MLLVSYAAVQICFMRNLESVFKKTDRKAITSMKTQNTHNSTAIQYKYMYLHIPLHSFSKGYLHQFERHQVDFFVIAGTFFFLLNDQHMFSFLGDFELFFE